MEEKGYLLLVLNTHMPFVLNPETDFPMEENWLFEAITECYIPLIEVFKRLIIDGTNFKITISISPPLLAMLSEELLQERFLRYIEDRILLSEKELERLKAKPDFFRLAKMYHKRFLNCRKVFEEDLNRDLISAFNYMKNSEKIELITSGGTHAYFPLWELYPEFVDLQIQIGIQQYQKYFVQKPIGFWLPECGYYPGLDELLQKSGIKYFFLDAHGITNGYPRPKFSVYAPIHCPSGVAAFGRDWDSHDLVWLKEKGYPGASSYLNYDRDIGFELEPDYIIPIIHNNHSKTGIKYLQNNGVVYNPDIAFSQCDEHANHFIYKCQRLIERLYDQLRKKPVLVALFDTEHFGHWWHEGPRWLDLIIRKLVYDQKTIKLVTATDYLRMNPTNQIVSPSMSSWGYQGYSESWLMGRNHWIYPKLYEMVEMLHRLIKMDNLNDAGFKSAINQYLRELLLAQSSDWAFIMHTQTAQQYAEKRVNDHIENLIKIYQQLIQKDINFEWLESIQIKNRIFYDMDIFGIYKNLMN